MLPLRYESTGFVQSSTDQVVAHIGGDWCHDHGGRRPGTELDVVPAQTGGPRGLGSAAKVCTFRWPGRAITGTGPSCCAVLLLSRQGQSKRGAMRSPWTITAPSWRAPPG